MTLQLIVWFSNPELDVAIEQFFGLGTRPDSWVVPVGIEYDYTPEEYDFELSTPKLFVGADVEVTGIKVLYIKCKQYKINLDTLPEDRRNELDALILDTIGEGTLEVKCWDDIRVRKQQAWGL